MAGSHALCHLLSFCSTFERMRDDFAQVLYHLAKRLRLTSKIKTMVSDGPPGNFLQEYPRLAGIVKQLNEFLIKDHPRIFGPDATHPILQAKRSKVIHDNLWGTVRFTWRELALIDSPIIQRLRDIHQTGLAFHVYPSARHTRFEHSLGAVTIAWRIFDAVLHRQRNDIRDLDDRFHETGLRGTGSLLVDSSFAVG